MTNDDAYLHGFSNATSAAALTLVGESINQVSTIYVELSGISNMEEVHAPIDFYWGRIRYYFYLFILNLPLYTVTEKQYAAMEHFVDSDVTECHDYPTVEKIETLLSYLKGYEEFFLNTDLYWANKEIVKKCGMEYWLRKNQNFVTSIVQMFTALADLKMILMDSFVESSFDSDIDSDIESMDSLEDTFTTRDDFIKTVTPSMLPVEGKTLL